MFSCRIGAFRKMQIALDDYRLKHCRSFNNRWWSSGAPLPKHADMAPMRRWICCQRNLQLPQRIMQLCRLISSLAHLDSRDIGYRLRPPDRLATSAGTYSRLPIRFLPLLEGVVIVDHRRAVFQEMRLHLCAASNPVPACAARIVGHLNRWFDAPGSRYRLSPEQFVWPCPAAYRFVPRLH